MNYNKFRAKKTEVAGRSFASKGEASLFHELTLRERCGEVRNIKCQTEVRLSDAQIIYKPDFEFEEKVNGEWVYRYGEYKGYETPEWRIKRRLWLAYGPGVLYVYKGREGRLMLHETLVPKVKDAE